MVEERETDANIKAIQHTTSVQAHAIYLIHQFMIAQSSNTAISYRHYLGGVGGGGRELAVSVSAAPTNITDCTTIMRSIISIDNTGMITF